MVSTASSPVIERLAQGAAAARCSRARVAGHDQVGVDLDAPQIIVLESIRSLDPPVSTVTPRASMAVARSLASSDAELSKPVGYLARELLTERANHPVAGLEQNHPRAGKTPRRDCRLNVRAVIASSPAISTPVGPPPTTTNVSHSARSPGSFVRSAASSAP